MDDQPETMDTWAILELMGHRRLAGRVTEETHFGVAMCRIDVPAVDDLAGFTQCYGGQAIYALTPVSEQIARDGGQAAGPAGRCLRPRLAHAGQGGRAEAVGLRCR